MRVHLYTSLANVSKYNQGEVIVATDKEGKGMIFDKYKGDPILHIDVDSTEIIEREDYVTRGFVNGTFNKYLIKKGN